MQISSFRGRGKVVSVLLAGGQGSRLHELTETECKPAVPFAGNRRIVDWTMGNVVRSGLDDLIVATQYRPQTLTSHLERRWRPAFDRGGLLVRHGPTVTGRPQGFVGTADAVTRCIADIDLRAPDHVVVLAADHIYEMDYGTMIAARRGARAAVTVAVDSVPVWKAQSFGVVATAADGRIARFLEKPEDPPHMPEDPSRARVSMGIYVFDWGWLRAALLADAEAPRSAHDFGHDLLPRAVKEGVAMAFDAGDMAGDAFYWRDVGTLDAYRLAQLDFRGDRRPCAIPDYPVAKRSAAQDAASAKLRADGNVVLPDSWVSPGARLKRTIVAHRAHIPPDVVIGEDHDEDAKWFRVTEGGTTLVTQAMLMRRAGQRSRAICLAP